MAVTFEGIGRIDAKNGSNVSFEADSLAYPLIAEIAGTISVDSSILNFDNVNFTDELASVLVLGDGSKVTITDAGTTPVGSGDPVTSVVIKDGLLVTGSDATVTFTRSHTIINSTTNPAVNALSISGGTPEDTNSVTFDSSDVTINGVVEIKEFSSLTFKNAADLDIFGAINVNGANSSFSIEDVTGTGTSITLGPISASDRANISIKDSTDVDIFGAVTTTNSTLTFTDVNSVDINGALTLAGTTGSNVEFDGSNTIISGNVTVNQASSLNFEHSTGLDIIGAVLVTGANANLSVDNVTGTINLGTLTASTGGHIDFTNSATIFTGAISVTSTSSRLTLTDTNVTSSGAISVTSAGRLQLDDSTLTGTTLTVTGGTVDSFSTSNLVLTSTSGSSSISSNSNVTLNNANIGNALTLTDSNLTIENSTTGVTTAAITATNSDLFVSTVVGTGLKTGNITTTDSALSFTGITATTGTSLNTGSITAGGNSSLSFTSITGFTAGAITLNGEADLSFKSITGTQTVAGLTLNNQNVVTFENNTGVMTFTAGITLSQDSVLKLTSAQRITIPSSARLSVGTGATIDVGGNRLTLSGTLALADGSIINTSIYVDNSTFTFKYGTITVTSLVLNPTDRIILNIDDSLYTYSYSTIPFLTITSGTIDPKNFITDHIIRLSGNLLGLEVGRKLTIDECLFENLQNILKVRVTPNIRAVAGLFLSFEEGDTAYTRVFDFITRDLRDAKNPETSVKQFIGESAINVTTAISQAIIEGQGLVYGRLDRIRELNAITPPAAGSIAPSAGSVDELNRVWVGGFGLMSHIKDTTYVLGYDYKTAGFSLGYDRSIPTVPGLRIGFSASFSFGTLHSTDDQTTVDIDTAGLGIYASYLTDTDLFVDASLAFSRATNDYKTDFIQNSLKSGSFDVITWQIAARFGKIFTLGDYKFIPSLGVRFISYNQDGWIETINLPGFELLANRFENRKDHQIDVPVLVKINTTFKVGSVSVVPELRLGWTYSPQIADDGLRVGFVGTNQTTLIHGIKPSRLSYEVGLGIKIITNSNLDIYFNYDFEANYGFENSNTYRNQQISLGLGYNF
jgi:outer membrane autotransporter protein